MLHSMCEVMTMIGGMTPEGWERYNLAVAYHLENYYQEYIGNIVILDRDYNELTSRLVHLFLKDNPKWIFGHEENYWYLTTASDLDGK